MRSLEPTPTLVLSLNPAIDLEWQVDHVHWEEKNTILSERRWAGGKGVNVARWLHFLGGHPRLVVPLGGTAGHELRSQIQREKLPAEFIPLQQATRTDVIVTTPEGRQLRFNPRGPSWSASEWRVLRQKVERDLSRCAQLILSGSLPPGTAPDLYARLIQEAHKRQVKTLLDCDGAPLVEGIKAKPFLVKPNVYELEQWTGQRLTTRRALARAALALAAKTQGWVLVSRGKQGGLLVHAQPKFTLWATAPEVKVINTNGAGDALLAAVARRLVLGNPPESWLRWGMAAGTAATLCAAGELPPANLLAQLKEKVTLNE